jgi:hypothetical protein
MGEFILWEFNKPKMYGTCGYQKYTENHGTHKPTRFFLLKFNENHEIFKKCWYIFYCHRKHLIVNFNYFKILINISGRIFADGVQIACFDDGLNDGGEF